MPAHIPIQPKSVNIFDAIDVDVEGELIELDTYDLRSLHGTLAAP